MRTDKRKKNIDSNAKSVYKKLKRALDFIFSFIAIVFLFFPISIISLIIMIDNWGNPFFSQERVGKDGKVFELYKLRTMKINAPKYLPTGELNDPNKYITKVGGILRKFSIDEIPQLVNILKGDMSFIGPRPLIQQEEEIHIMRKETGVYSVRPGLTGLAQISGRDTVSPKEKVALDIKYVENMSIKTDTKILLLTIPKVFGSDGVVEGYKH